MTNLWSYCLHVLLHFNLTILWHDVVAEMAINLMLWNIAWFLKSGEQRITYLTVLFHTPTWNLHIQLCWRKCKYYISEMKFRHAPDATFYKFIHPTYTTIYQVVNHLSSTHWKHMSSSQINYWYTMYTTKTGLILFWIMNEHIHCNQSVKVDVLFSTGHMFCKCCLPIHHFGKWSCNTMCSDC